jgi:hypothetical protein
MYAVTYLYSHKTETCHVSLFRNTPGYVIFSNSPLGFRFVQLLLVHVARSVSLSPHRPSIYYSSATHFLNADFKSDINPGFSSPLNCLDQIFNLPNLVREKDVSPIYTV